VAGPCYISYTLHFQNRLMHSVLYCSACCRGKLKLVVTFLCDREALIMSGSRPARGCCAGGGSGGVTFAVCERHRHTHLLEAREEQDIMGVS
jgi:hypothetical protein